MIQVASGVLSSGTALGSLRGVRCGTIAIKHSETYRLACDLRVVGITEVSQSKSKALAQKAHLAGSIDGPSSSAIPFIGSEQTLTKTSGGTELSGISHRCNVPVQLS